MSLWKKRVAVLKAKFKIKLKLVDEKDEEIRVVSAYGTASYPTDPEILSWCQLIPQNAQPPPDTPYIHLYEMSGGETVAGVCQQYRLDSNIKMLFIVANKKQQDLDNEYEHLKACSLSFSIIIIPRRFKPAIQDCLSTANTRCFAVISPIYDEGCTAFDILLPKKPEEIRTITKVFQDVVQNELIVSLEYKSGKIKERLMKYILEETDMLLKTETTEIYLGKQELHRILNTLLAQSHFEKVFNQDFPFFFNFICLIYRYQDMYSIKELIVFVKKCISKLASMPTELLVENLKRFIIKGNFELFFGGLESNTNIFRATAGSCLEICAIKDQNPDQYFGYCTTVLISIALKLYKVSEKVSESKFQKETIWQTSLINHYKENGITNEEVVCFAKGLNAMSMILGDCIELMLGWKDLAHIFTSKPHSFATLSIFIAKCDAILVENGKNNMLDSFLEPVTNFYYSKKNSLVKLLNKGTIIDEGLKFISYLVEHRSLTQLEPLLKRWVALLVYLLDLNNTSDIQKMFQFHCNNSWDDYHTYLNNQMGIVLMDHCQEMHINSFVAVIKLGNFEKSKIICKFMEHWNIPDCIQIQEESFKTLLILANEHLDSDKKSESSFFRLLEKVLVNYKERGCAMELLLEVLKLNISLPSNIESKFVNLLKNMIKTQRLQGEIYNRISDIFNNLPEKKNSFCLALMNIIIEEVFQMNEISLLDSDLLPSLFDDIVDTDSVRFNAAITLLTCVSNHIGQSKPFVCLNDYSQMLTSMAKSVKNIWKLFSSSDYYSLAIFKESTKGVPRCYELVESILSNFKIFLECIYEFTSSKKLTYKMLEILLEHYNTYVEIANCCTETTYTEMVVVEKLQLQSLQSSYDCNTKKVHNLLVKPYANQSFLIEVILSNHNIKYPSYLKSELIFAFLIISSRNSANDLLTHYEPNPDCTLNDIELVATKIEEFMCPLLPSSLDTLVFLEYHNNHSEILGKCIEHFKPEHDDNLCLEQLEPDHQMKMNALNDAVKQTEDVIFDLISDNISIWTLKKIFGIKYNCRDTENEVLQKFCQMKSKEPENIYISESFTSVSELLLACDYVLAMQKTFQAFQLDNCLNDPVMKDLVKITEISEQFDISIREAKIKVAKIKDCLKLDNIIDNPILCLFLYLQDHKSQNFYQFALERGYHFDDTGMETFRQEHQLVTTELLHEDHDTELLSILQSAMHLTAPFFKKESHLLELWKKLSGIKNMSAATTDLQSVNEHIGIIKEWFHEETDTTKNYLKSILGTGAFCYSFSNGHCVEVTIMFYTINKDDFKEEHIWSIDGIQSFCQKLSFMNFEADSDFGLYSKWFFYLKKFAFELLGYYEQLQHNGHPHYIVKTKVKLIHINPNFGGWKGKWLDSWRDCSSMFEFEIKDTKESLAEFKTNSNSCRKKHPIVSFFHSQKLKALYHTLIEEHVDMNLVLHLTGFLLEISPNSCPLLEKVIKDLISTCVRTNESLYLTEIIGKFLEGLISDFEVQNFLSTFISTQILSPNKNNPFEVSLISAYNFTNLEITKLIYWIFDEGFPWYFQLFRCSSSTTVEEIELFFDRIDNFPQLKYLVLGIDLIRNELQQVFLKRCSKTRSEVLSSVHKSKNFIIFFVEYSPSLFQHVSWINKRQKLLKDQLPLFENLHKKCRGEKIGKSFKRFEIIHGLPGSGKTHYIKNEIKVHKKNRKKRDQEAHKVISINENFTPSDMIQTLHSIPLMNFDMLYYFNISLFMPQDYDKPEYKAKFNQLAHDINWFFFDYLLLGYVEILFTPSHSTSPINFSLTLPTGFSISILVEAPYWKVDSPFEKFKDFFPCFALLGDEKTPSTEFDTKAYDHAQLVCKYLLAEEDKNLDHIYMGENAPPIKIGNMYQDMPSKECSAKLKNYFPPEIAEIKIKEALYLKYMERRCLLLEKCSQLQYLQGGSHSFLKDEKGRCIENIDATRMRSTLLKIMKEEVRDFCKSSILNSSESHQQIIYELDSNDGIIFRFFCTGTPSEHKIEQLRAIGAELEVLSTRKLHDCLSAALNVKKNPETNRISLINEKKFVLTKDFVKKMLHIHERKECGMPVIIEGETGVGKTFLLEMLSSLWNDSWNQQLKNQREFVKDCFLVKLKKLKIKEKNPIACSAILQAIFAFEGNEQEENKVTLKNLRLILKLNDPDNPSQPLYLGLKHKIEINTYDPVLASVELPPDSISGKKKLLMINYLNQLQTNNINEEIMAQVINGILYGTLKSMFYKKSIHSAMTSKEIDDFFHEIHKIAKNLLSRYNSYQKIIKHKPSTLLYQKPVVTVFLDEINTSSCPGYLKEIIIDRKVNGQTLPENVFIVAACNPHRGNSFASVTKQSDVWYNSSYYVQSLPPTLDLLKWNYEQLKERDEIEYIREKFNLSYKDTEPKELGDFMTQQIAKAQKLIRVYAFQHLKGLIANENKTLSNHEVERQAKLFSQSTVSQRDIQRIFTLYSWLQKWFEKKYNHENDETGFQIKFRSIFIALALVYYFRLDDKCRKDFREKMHEERAVGTCGIPITFEKALRDELDWVHCTIDLPAGIAPTDALKENIYATVVCTMVRIPIIIVGPPGSSKTLSFKIVMSNFQGCYSQVKELRNFKSLNPHIYQCSRKSTSHEIEKVFQRAKIRQDMFNQRNINSQAVVLMDEAGLPEDSHESLKVLHYLLENPMVSFVGISNEVLDAAKTNRAICIYRSEPSTTDLMQLAKYSLTCGKHRDWKKVEDDLLDGFVKVYEMLMEDESFNKTFGLRDFVHFFTHLGQDLQSHKLENIRPQFVVNALQHNFNGTERFHSIAANFFHVVGSKFENMQRSSLIEILRSSFKHHMRDLSSENQTRYKLLIDSSEDQSLIRLLFKFQILERKSTRIISCSKLPADGESLKLYTTAVIRHSAMQGLTVVIYQAEEIQESFYDLFNQRFTCIKTVSGDKIYTHIAIGTIIKPTRVDPSFNCVMVLSSSEVKTTPKPFLNRFEKYAISHEVLFNEVLSTCPFNVKNLLIYIKDKISEFVDKCGRSSFYGYTDQTVDSLLHLIIPNCCTNEVQTVTTVHDPQCECYSNIDIFVRCLLYQFSITFGINLKMGCCQKFSETVKFCLSLIPDCDKSIKNLLDTASYFDLNESMTKAMKEIESSHDDILVEPMSSFTKYSLLILREVLLVYLKLQLIQVMVPESLVINSDIDEFYKHWYLHRQHHFSLEQLINSPVKRCDIGTANKVICYTRTSQCVLEIIPENLCCETKAQLSNQVKNFLNLQTLDDFDCLMHTHIISSIYTSQESLLKVYDSFFKCPCSKALILVADMNKFSKETINQIRLLVEEAEMAACSKIMRHKKFVYFLLHFSSNLFYTHCYPTLFLEGWQHIYFDIIGEMQDEHCVDIQKWLNTCLLEKPFQLSSADEGFVSDSTMNAWLKECVPLISANVIIRQMKDFPSPTAKSIEIQSYWSKLLFHFSIGDIIKEKFDSFWHLQAVNEASFQAANYATIYRWNSSLSERIQSTVCTSFTQITLFLLHIVNQQLALHTVVKLNPADPGIKLFKEFFHLIPLPDTLEEIQLKINILAQQSDTSCLQMSSFKFPFFLTVYEAMRNVLNTSFRAVVHSITTGRNTHFILSELVSSAAFDLLEKSPDEYSLIAIKAMRNSDVFWKHYFDDAISNKFSRDVGKFSKTFLEQRLYGIDSADMTRRLVLLHYHLHTYSIDSSELALLRSLDECMPEYDKGCPDLKDNLSILTTVVDVLYMSLENLSSNYSYAKLMSSYSKMINYFLNVTVDGINCSIKTKWSILCAVFHIYQQKLDPLSFIQQVNDRIKNEKSTHLKVSTLADAIVSIVFNTESTSVSLLSSIECPQNFYLIVEPIIDHYLKNLHDSVSDEEANWIYHVISIVVSFNYQEDWYRLLKLKYKYHLLSMLGRAKNTSNVSRQRHPNSLLLFNDEMRKIFGVLVHHEIFFECSEYYPSGILNCSSFHCRVNDLLIYSLCDIYFELIMESIQKKEYNLSDLVSYYQKISSDYASTTCHQSTKKLLLVEKRAVINAVIQFLARSLEDETQIAELDENLNEILNDSSLITKNFKSNALVFLMRILQVNRSESQLSLKLKNDALFREQLNGFECLRPVHSILKNEVIDGQRNQFILFLKNNCTDDYTIFNDIYRSIKSVINLRYREKGISDLIDNAYVCCSNGSDKKPLFTMSVFLSIFMEFFQKKDTSSVVLPRLSNELSWCIDRQYWDFIAWLGNPNKAQRNIAFNEFFENQENEAHVQCLLELTAVVLGSPECSSHFWTHLIVPDAISTDFVPGCLILGTDNSYLEIMSFNDESLEYTYRRSLNWLSLLILQWMNYGLLCVSMAVHSVNAKRLPLPDNVLMNLKLLWNKVALESNLTYEERDCLIFSCVYNLYKVLQEMKLLDSWLPISSTASISQRYEGLQQYEQIVHKDVFLPAWNSMKSTKSFIKFGSTLGSHMRELRKSVPYLNIKCSSDPLKAFLATIFTSTKLHDTECQLYTLYQFIIQRPVLNIGAALLPTLVDFYCWIHNHLLYKIKLEDAESLSVTDVLSSVLEQFFPTQKKEKMDQLDEIIRQLYLLNFELSNLSGHYQCYKKKVLSLRIAIDSDMKFCNFLSFTNSEDLLFKVILDIVNRYNEFLNGHKPKDSTHSKILLIEATMQTCGFGTSTSCNDLNDMKDIILKHHSINDIVGRHQASDDTLLHDYVPDVFYLDSIQKEIVQRYITYKQYIDIDNFRKEFEFYSYLSVDVPRNLFYTSTCFEDTVKQVDQLLGSNECSLTNDFEVNFHSLNYDCLLSICGGLYLVLKLLLKNIPIYGVGKLSNETIQSFLIKIYNRATSHDVLREVGITRQSSSHFKSGLDDHHYMFLCGFHIKHIVSLSNFFQNCLSAGSYDFCHLPYAMKIKLDDNTNDFSLWIQQQNCDKVLQDTTHALFKSEQQLMETANEDSNTQIGSVIKDGIHLCISTTSVKYYMHIQLELRKRLLDLLKKQKSVKTSPSNEHIPSPQTSTVPSPLPISTPLPPPITPSPPRALSPQPIIIPTSPELPQSIDVCLEAAKDKTAAQIADFLVSINLHKSAKIVRSDKSFTGDVIYDAMPNDDTLTGDLSMDSPIDRLRFRVLFKRWLTETVSKVSSHDIAELCSKVEKLKEYGQKFIDNEIDGEMLVEAGTDVLEELGIKTLRLSLLKKHVTEKIKTLINDNQQAN